MNKKTHNVVTHTFLWLDLGYAADMIYHSCDNCPLYVGFQVFRIVDRVGHQVLYQFDGEDLNSTTTDMDKAVPFFEGRMEVEGCVNGEFNQEPMLVHFCSEEDIRTFSEMTLRVYRGAAALLQEG